MAVRKNEEHDSAGQRERRRTCGGCNHSQHVVWYPCPACQRESVYLRGLDRYLHTDGTDNTPCWRAVVTGQIPERQDLKP